MKKIMFKISKLFSLIVFSVYCLTFSLNSAADHILCTAVDHGDITNFVSNTTGCELGEDDQDFINPLMVNDDDGMFGYTDWLFDDRYDPGDGMSGTFSFADAVSGDVMLVFKGPDSNSGTQPPEFVGYLLEIGESSFDWQTMFAKWSNDEWNFQGVSHITVYYRDGDVPPACIECEPIPEPQTLLILSAGLLGLFISRKKLFK